MHKIKKEKETDSHSNNFMNALSSIPMPLGRNKVLSKKHKLSQPNNKVGRNRN